MYRGYVKTWRKLLHSDLFKNPKLAHFWHYCLLKASHKAHQVLVGYQAVDLLPGQFIMGRVKAAQETGLSEKSIRTAVASLRAQKRIRTASDRASRFTLVTLLNWRRYQSDPKTNGQSAGQSGASEGPVKDQSATTYKNDKHGKHVKKTTLAGFDEFWAAWPKHHRKTSKKKCKEIWKKKGLEEKTEHILAVLRALKAGDQWTKDGAQYVPAPLVWLNQDRWDCEIDDAVSVASGVEAGDELARRNWAKMEAEEASDPCQGGRK